MGDLLDNIGAWFGGLWAWLVALYQAVAEADVLATGLAAVGNGWQWWRTLFEVDAWQEIGAFLVPLLLVVVVAMFVGIVRMQQSG